MRVDQLGDDDSDQHDVLRRAGVRRANIFTDAAPGMTTASSRPGWRLLLEELRAGDTVVVSSLKTLGGDHTDVALTLGALELMRVSVRAEHEGLDTNEHPGPTLEAVAAMVATGPLTLRPSAA